MAKSRAWPRRSTLRLRPVELTVDRTCALGGRSAMRALNATELRPSQARSDLLRLGEEAEGWALAKAVHEKDDYDVEAFNLVTLQDTMAKYATITSDDFVLRLSVKEAAVYGPRVLDLLTKAKRTLTAKYGVELARPTYVEVFADKIARHPESIGLGGAVRPSAGLKDMPTPQPPPVRRP